MLHPQQSHQKRVEADIGEVNEPNNVHFTQQGNDLNVSVERKKKNNMQKEKGKAKVKQHGLDQHRDLSVLINGTRAFCKETGKLEINKSKFHDLIDMTRKKTY